MIISSATCRNMWSNMNYQMVSEESFCIEGAGKLKLMLVEFVLSISTRQENNAISLFLVSTPCRLGKFLTPICCI